MWLLRALWFVLVRFFSWFRSVPVSQLAAHPVTFTDPTRLVANVEEIDRHDPPPTKVFWQFHHRLRALIRSSYPQDAAIFDAIALVGKNIQDNQWAYVIYRRAVLILFLVISLMLSPSDGLKNLYGQIVAFLPQHWGNWPALAIWCVATILLWFVAFGLNRLLKGVYDNSVALSTSNLAGSLQQYNNTLYDGFRKCLELINSEEAEFGSRADESYWPKRARNWALLAFRNSKRVEQVQRYTENFVWESRRMLTIVDHFSRVLTYLILGTFLATVLFVVSNMPPYKELFTPGSYQIWPYLVTATLLTVWGWEVMGKEDENVFDTSMFAPDRQKNWIRSADFRDAFAEQIFRDKSRIQRDRRYKPGGGTSDATPDDDD